MPFQLSRRGLAAVSNVTDLDDEQIEILWIVKDRVEEPGGIATLSNIIKETGRGREAIRDVRQLVQSGHLTVFDY